MKMNMESTGCSVQVSITSSSYLVLTYYYIHVVRIVVHTSILLRRSITQSSEKAKADAPML